MSSTAPKFVGLCGFPEEGEYVPVDTRAKAILIRQGWTPPAPAEEPLDCTGLLMHSIDPKHDECTWCDMPRTKAEQERCPIWFES